MKIQDTSHKFEKGQSVMELNNIDIFVDNDFVKIRNKSDLKLLKEMEELHKADIYSKEENENKTKFYELDKKIYNETIEIDYTYTSDLLEKLFLKLELPISITPA